MLDKTMALSKGSDDAHATMVQVTQINNEHIYQELPVNHIRVIDLFPGSQWDLIEVQLHVVAIDDPGPYQALSYQAQEVLIWIGEENKDVDTKRAFEVAEARHDYGQQLRILDSPRGRCAILMTIPDRDMFDLVTEVQQRFPPDLPDGIDPMQLQVLDHLLAKSHAGFPEVDLLLYIGHRDIDNVACSGVHLPIAVLTPEWDLEHVKHVSEWTFSSFDNFLREATKPSEMRLSDNGAAQVLQALNYLTKRQYFRQAWIVQEVILAPKSIMVCGRHEVSFVKFYVVYGIDPTTRIYVKNFMLDDFKFFEAEENVRTLAKWWPFLHNSNLLGEEFMAGHSAFNQLGYLNKRGRQGDLGEICLGSLLLDFGEQRSTDPRDKVFSLVGIIKRFSTLPREVEWAEECVDYGLETREVFWRAAKHLVETFSLRQVNEPKPSRYHILHFFRESSFNPGDDNMDVNLPTWVPNWSSISRQGWLVNNRRIYEIDSLIPYRARVQEDSLFITASIVDKVSFCSNVLECDQEMYGQATLCDKLVGKEGSTRSPYGGVNAQFEAFWRTVIADDPIGSKSQTDFTYHFQEFDAVNRWVSHCCDMYSQVSRMWLEDLDKRPLFGPLLDDLRKQKAQKGNLNTSP
ncbi:uncharacterized protein CDV56_101226 [Aspergillus thermomutatus]|uniref:Heterokaryon incompatibility domain-containing protein n=1 Tax=Aspergillus thermomutatus TaxID=41047 RepID=A0A397G3M0_ASPTH|nr:uncharacterized protein CDV56_101226 [Aspergillus thermomutatus]RHZ43463.1 hypothetical protein CDV56_101226 [Aspergillus thermomutatus]